MSVNAVRTSLLCPIDAWPLDCMRFFQVEVCGRKYTTTGPCQGFRQRHSESSFRVSTSPCSFRDQSGQGQTCSFGLWATAPDVCALRTIVFLFEPALLSTAWQARLSHRHSLNSTAGGEQWLVVSG